jgi:hypothetical protein
MIDNFCICLCGLRGGAWWRHAEAQLGGRGSLPLVAVQPAIEGKGTAMSRAGAHRGPGGNGVAARPKNDRGGRVLERERGRKKERDEKRD